MKGCVLVRPFIPQPSRYGDISDKLKQGFNKIISFLKNIFSHRGHRRHREFYLFSPFQNQAAEGEKQKRAGFGDEHKIRPDSVGIENIEMCGYNQARIRQVVAPA